MLILTRKLGESIVIDGRITVKIVRMDGDHVRLGIEAPAEVPVHRQEVYVEIQRNNHEATTHAKASLPRLAVPNAGMESGFGTSATPVLFEVTTPTTPD
jgi:carbon storage regulator